MPLSSLHSSANRSTRREWFLFSQGLWTARINGRVPRSCVVMQSLETLLLPSWEHLHSTGSKLNFRNRLLVEGSFPVYCSSCKKTHRIAFLFRPLWMKRRNVLFSKSSDS